jgi:hypothetical protein
MKKVLLGLLFTAFGFAATAQQLSPVEGQKGYIQTAVPHLAKKNPIALSKAVGDTVQAWYDWIDTARNFATFRGYNNTFLFPDTLVKQIYGSAGGGGTELGYTHLHSIGQIFDVNSSYFLNKSAYIGGYRLDSVAIAYGYKYHMPGTVDTLVFQFYNDHVGTASIRKSSLSGGDSKTAMVSYDANRVLGAGAIKEFVYLLTEQDTSTAFRFLSVPVPGGMNINAKSLSGFTVTYKPGYSYQLDDTLDSKWDAPVPTKLLNNFKILVQQDMEKTNDNAYNNGVRLISSVRYGLPANGWEGRYIPGDAWLSYTEHIRALFMITYVEQKGTSAIEEAKAQNGYGLGNIFPNPTQGNSTLEFTLPKTENVKVQVYNVVGQLVSTVATGTYASGKHTVNIDAENMKPGVYFYTITAGNFTQTKRFSVVK